jgi:hypothetical protein
MLEAHYYPLRGPAGQRAPVVYIYSRADGILLRGDRGNAPRYLNPGMAFLDVDGPGHGGSPRLKRLYMPPDIERVVKTVIDYLLTRADVDPNRIAVRGSSMGGYSAPPRSTRARSARRVPSRSRSGTWISSRHSRTGAARLPCRSRCSSTLNANSAENDWGQERGFLPPGGFSLLTNR